MTPINSKASCVSTPPGCKLDESFGGFSLCVCLRSVCELSADGTSQQLSEHKRRFLMNTPFKIVLFGYFFLSMETTRHDIQCFRGWRSLNFYYSYLLPSDKQFVFPYSDAYIKLKWEDSCSRLLWLLAGCCWWSVMGHSRTEAGGRLISRRPAVDRPETITGC